jgi:hypothetical protein
MATPYQPIQRRESIHGFITLYTNEADFAAQYLRSDLGPEEARTIYDAARLTGQAHFEDDREGQYTLVYNRGANTYTIVVRQRR